MNRVISSETAGCCPMIEACGYAAVCNPDAKDGLWVIGGKRQVVYGRMNVPPSEQIKAAGTLV